MKLDFTLATKKSRCYFYDQVMIQCYFIHVTYCIPVGGDPAGSVFLQLCHGGWACCRGPDHCHSIPVEGDSGSGNEDPSNVRSDK